MLEGNKVFYTLDEVREYLKNTKDNAFSNDDDIMRLIQTNQLTPYLKYEGKAYGVLDDEKMSDEKIKSVIASLNNTITSEITKLQVGELINPLNYDYDINVNNIIYLVKKLLFTYETRRATRLTTQSINIQGTFRLSTFNIRHSELGFEVCLGASLPVSQAIEIDSNYQTSIQNKLKGYILDPSNLVEPEKTKFESDYNLVFASNDLAYILEIIKASHENTKLKEKIANANRTINQKNKEIKRLEKDLRESQSAQPKNNVKDSIYSLISALKILLLDPDINAYHFKSDSLKSTGQPTQGGLIQYIVDMRIPKLSKRSIDDIFSESNKRNDS